MQFQAKFQPIENLYLKIFMEMQFTRKQAQDKTYIEKT